MHGEPREQPFGPRDVPGAAGVHRLAQQQLGLVAQRPPGVPGDCRGRIEPVEGGQQVD